MATTAVSVTSLNRNSVSSGVATTGWSAVMATANTYLIPFVEDEKVGFVINWSHCATSTEYTMLVVLSHGDYWRNTVGGATAQVFNLWTTSCGVHTYFFGPYESAQFGCLSTSTSYGAELGEFYLSLYHIWTSSSGGTASSTATAAAQGDAYIRGFKFPSVSFST